jgi:hypothetical protein
MSCITLGRFIQHAYLLGEFQGRAGRSGLGETIQQLTPVLLELQTDSSCFKLLSLLKVK